MCVYTECVYIYIYTYIYIYIYKYVYIFARVVWIWVKKMYNKNGCFTTRNNQNQWSGVKF